jgi:uncharacterized membrane protein
MTRAHWTFFVLLVALALGLRLWGIGSWSLNNDEIAEVRWSSGTFAELVGELKRDRVHPPLDYFVQHALGALHAVEWARRLPAVIFSTFTVIFLMFLGRWWHSPAAGIAAGVLLAVSPSHIRYSQEVRPYAMGIFFLAGALVALELYAMTRRRGWAVWWFALVFLSGATLYLAGLVAAIASIARIVIDRRETLRNLWRGFPLIAIAWTILYAPWLGVVLAAARAQPPAPPERLSWWWWQHRLQAFGTGAESFQPVSLGSWLFWLVVLLGVVASFRAPRLRTATVWLVGGFAATVIILQLRPHYANSPRYLLAAMLAAPLLAGAGIATLWRRVPGKAVSVVLIAAIASFSGITLDAYYRGDRPDWRAIAVYVHQRAKPGDTVILTNNWVVRNFGFYWQRLPERSDVRVERFILQARDFAGPAWIVTGQCRARAPLEKIGVIYRHPVTELAEVRYVREGQSVSMGEELCPE